MTKAKETPKRALRRSELTQDEAKEAATAARRPPKVLRSDPDPSSAPPVVAAPASPARSTAPKK